MAGSWDAETYRERAKKWREQAEALHEGKEKDACLVLADGYANLVRLIELESNGYPATQQTGGEAAGLGEDLTLAARGV